MEAYLDYNSTTPLDPAVLEAMRPYLTNEFANPSSFHQKGQKARHGIEEARETIADSLEVEPGDIVFTSGGTEADNLAVKGMMEWKAPERNHLVISTIEHQAVLHPAQYLEKKGIKVSAVRTGENGIVDFNALKEAVTDKTALVSLMHVNNEVGSIQPIAEAARLAHSMGAFFHTDAVQAFGKLPIHPEEIGIDLMSVSAHKIYGPKGVGALYIRKGLKIKAMTHGGHQEKNVRPGTENVAAIAGFGKAVQLMQRTQESESKRILELRERLHEGIKKSVPEIHLNGDTAKRIYNTLNISFDGLDGETLLMNLDLKNIFTSTGSACTAGSVEPSHVLLAMGLPEKRARGAIRFSLGRFTTKDEVDYAVAQVPVIIERLRKVSVQKHVG